LGSKQSSTPRRAEDWRSFDELKTWLIIVIEKRESVDSPAESMPPYDRPRRAGIEHGTMANEWFYAPSQKTAAPDLLASRALGIPFRCGRPGSWLKQTT